MIEDEGIDHELDYYVPRIGERDREDDITKEVKVEASTFDGIIDPYIFSDLLANMNITLIGM